MKAVAPTRRASLRFPVLSQVPIRFAGVPRLFLWDSLVSSRLCASEGRTRKEPRETLETRKQPMRNLREIRKHHAFGNP